MERLEGLRGPMAPGLGLVGPDDGGCFESVASAAPACLAGGLPPAKGVPKGAGKGAPSARTPSWVGQASWNFSEHGRMAPPAAPPRAPSEPPPPTPSRPTPFPAVYRLPVEGDGRYPYRDRHYHTRVAFAAPAA